MVTNRVVKIGSVPIGGGHPVMVQSMTNTQTENVQATLAQIYTLQKGGCQVIRIAVPHKRAVRALPAILEQCTLPVVADIQFDYSLAIASAEQGVHGLRINPGTMGDEEKVKKVLYTAGERGIPIRIGVNSGSVPQAMLDKFSGPCAEALVETLLQYVEFFEGQGFYNTIVSLKSTDVLQTIEANRLIAKHLSYPIHIGLTEAGTAKTGIIRSCAALAPLLLEGIGDTIRISLTGDPLAEVEAAWDLLNALQLRQRGLVIMSCPTCARCHIDLESLVLEVKSKTEHIQKPMTVAIMGCPVNGPGEAREADLGIAGGKDFGVLFIRGEVQGRYPYGELASRLLEAIEDSLHCLGDGN